MRDQVTRRSSVPSNIIVEAQRHHHRPGPRR
jgi:hypothetical protein